MAKHAYRAEDFTPTAFVVLGVDAEADHATCKRAYRKLARGCHPDTHRKDPDAEGRFKALNAAYELVSTEENLANYRVALERSRKTRSGFTDLFSMFGGGKGDSSKGDSSNASKDASSNVSAETLARRQAAEQARIHKAQEAEQIQQLAEAECQRLNALAKAEYARDVREHQAKLVAWEARRKEREDSLAAAIGQAASRGGIASEHVDRMLAKPVSAISRMFSRPRLRVGAKIIELDATHPAPMPHVVMERITVPQGLNKAQAAAWRMELMRLLEAQNRKN